MINSKDIFYAKLLRSLREKRKIKQFTVAQALGLKRQQEYSEYENGKRHFSDEFIKSICRYFNLTELEFRQHKTAPLFKEKAIENTISVLGFEDLKGLTSEISSQVILLNYKKLILEDELEIIKFKMKNLQIRTLELPSPIKVKI